MTKYLPQFLRGMEAMSKAQRSAPGAKFWRHPEFSGHFGEASDEGIPRFPDINPRGTPGNASGHQP
ncbi:hypothetical protein RSAG8_11559, partial [Rhizoctonia solani AG-8 WAC10335]